MSTDPDSVEQRIAAIQRELDQAEEKASELEDDDKLDSTWPNYQAYRDHLKRMLAEAYVEAKPKPWYMPF